MQNRSGTTAEMIFHNQNKISCLQEKGAYISTIRHLFGVSSEITKGELKMFLYISIVVAQVSENKI